MMEYDAYLVSFYNVLLTQAQVLRYESHELVNYLINVKTSNIFAYLLYC